MLYKKPGSRFWWYAFTFKKRRIQKSTKVENLREAQGIEKAAWTQLARGEVGISDKPVVERKTIGQLLDALTEDFTVRKKATARNLNLISMVKTELGETWADMLTSCKVREYLSKLQKPQKSKKKGRRSKSLAVSTIKHRLQILVSAFELENATREDSSLEPLRVPRFPKLKEEGNERSGFLSRAQFDVLCSHLPADLRDFALFGFLVGWRKSAIVTLEWTDVRDGNVYLRGIVSKNKKPYFVPVAGELAELIERRKQARGIETPDGVVLSNLVFHRSGQPIQEFRKSWRTACRLAECPETLFHDLRRSAARSLIRSGVTKDVAKRVGGWKTDSMFTRYNVTGEEDLRDAMEKVNEYHKAEQQRIVQIAR
jgi:integrase